MQRSPSSFDVLHGARGFAARFRLPAAALAAALVLAACGDGDGGGETTTSSASQSPGSGNQAPTVSGSPPSQVMAGSTYTFTPTVSDPEQDPLTFSITNLPGWASFDQSTGAVTGTPTAADVGQYTGIRLSISDGQNTVNVGPFTVSVVATANGSASLSWTPPTQFEDGTPLGNSLAGYVIYWGQSQGNYTNSVTVNNPGLTAYTVTQLTPGTWYFTATALSTSGVESTFSNVASKQIM